MMMVLIYEIFQLMQLWQEKNTKFVTMNSIFFEIRITGYKLLWLFDTYELNWWFKVICNIILRFY